MSGFLSDNSRDSLKHVRQGLLRLHKMLLDQERVDYENARGKIGNSYEFLQLVLKDPWFDWLHRLSELIVQMDEALDTRDQEHPTTDEDAEALLARAKTLLRTCALSACRRIVFFVPRRFLSFHTARVIHDRVGRGRWSSDVRYASDSDGISALQRSAPLGQL